MKYEDKMCDKNLPCNQHVILNIGKKLRMVLSCYIQAFPMKTQDLQTVQHVKKNVWFFKP